MNDYRRLTDFTDDEIRTILTDIFNPVRIENIVRHENDETNAVWYRNRFIFYGS